MKKFASQLVVVWSLVAVGACATAAQQELLRRNEKSNATYAAMSACVQRIDASQPAQLAQKRFLTDLNDPQKLEKLTINDHATADEKRAMIETVRSAAECRKIAIEGFAEVHPDAAMEQLLFYNALDALYVQMLRDELTIGQFNERGQNLRVEFAERWNALGRRLDGELANAHQSEIAQRQALAQMLQTWSLQQQAIAAQQQAALAQYQGAVNSTAPIYTKCAVVGNNVRCTTQR